MRENVEKILLEVGIMPNLKGFRFICDAVEMIAHGASATIEIYRSIAQKSNERSLYTVERAIRHAKSKLDEQKWKEITGARADLTNSEFLHALTLLVQKAGGANNE